MSPVQTVTHVSGTDQGLSGWGTWIRTKVGGVRVRSPTARRSPSRGPVILTSLGEGRWTARNLVREAAGFKPGPTRRPCECAGFGVPSAALRARPNATGPAGAGAESPPAGVTPVSIGPMILISRAFTLMADGLLSRAADQPDFPRSPRDL